MPSIEPPRAAMNGSKRIAGFVLLSRFGYHLTRRGWGNVRSKKHREYSHDLRAGFCPPDFPGGQYESIKEVYAEGDAPGAADNLQHQDN